MSIRDLARPSPVTSGAGTGLARLVRARARVTGKAVLLLTPSQGLGGGIERYVATVQSVLDDAGVLTRRLDLARPGLDGHRALLAAGAEALGGLPGPARLVVAHRALLPVAVQLARRFPADGISVICHGSDVWGSRLTPRRWLESRLMRRRDVRLVAASSFTAGALLARGPAAILPPGLSKTWFDQLAAAAAGERRAAGQAQGPQPKKTPPPETRNARSAAQPQAAEPSPAPGKRPGLELMTAFRLADWRDKGLPEVTAAISALDRRDIRLTVCGSGAPPADLLAHVREHPWCTLRPGLADAELARQFAEADLFVLATRTRAGSRPSGEGFGLVLLEAQVAGTAVVGPAHGGSPDAYLERVTGATPRDEGAAALGQVLSELTSQPSRLADMGEQGGSWPGPFAPHRYAELVLDRLL